MGKTRSKRVDDYGYNRALDKEQLIGRRKKVHSNRKANNKNLRRFNNASAKDIFDNFDSMDEDQ